MSRTSTLAAALALTLSLYGCGGSEPAPAPAPEPAAEVVTQPAAVVEAPVVEEAMPVEEAAPVLDGSAEPAAAETVAAPVAADENHTKLIGSKWKLGEFDVHFKDAETVHLNGGPLTMMTAGKGLDAKYAYTAGSIRINAMGQSKTGTWDGETLSVDGEAGVKAE